MYNPAKNYASLEVVFVENEKLHYKASRYNEILHDTSMKFLT